MATWTGKPKTFKIEVYTPPDYYNSDYVQQEFNWRYSTTTDSLTVTSKTGECSLVDEQTMSQEYAEAMLWCLAGWYNCYVSEESLDKMIAEIRKGRE